MADCLLTLDYELFFQKSGDASVSLLKPTAELLEVLERIGGKAVFFVDTIYLNLLKKSEIPQDAELYGKSVDTGLSYISILIGWMSVRKIMNGYFSPISIIN